jgi:hypothetical protein
MSKDHNDGKVTQESEAGEVTTDSAPEKTAGAASKLTLKNKHKDIWHWAITHKKLSLPVAGVVLVALLLLVPFTRYGLAGLVIKQNFTVSVIDARTHKPVSNATVNLDGKKATTGSNGVATIRLPVGEATLTIIKPYYKSLSREVLVPVGKPRPLVVELTATGRAVQVAVVNTISGKPVGNAALKAEGTVIQTDKKGEATIVLPADKLEIEAELSGSGYNTSRVKIKVTDQKDPANTFKITPAGKVYFLSNASGKLDVVKTNLDGTERKVVLSGTGNESKPETALLATRDWKYLALLSRRDGGKNDKLFLIDTANDTLTTMDEGDATFTLAGWEDHRFIYTVNRNAVKEWQPKKQALKSFDADAKKLTTIDQTAGEGTDQSNYVREQFDTAYVRQGHILYAKNWSGGYLNSGTIYGMVSVPGKQVTFNSAKPDGSDKKVIKSFTASPGTQASYLALQTRPYGAHELYLQWQDSYFEYEDGKIKDLPGMTNQQFYNADYATYLASPSGKATFWTVDRDGKLAFLVGDQDGNNEKTVVTLSSDYQIYGWHSDDYLLVSKKGSELLLLPASGAAESQLFKITDYYRPVYRYFGYGGGYGGL